MEIGRDELECVAKLFIDGQIDFYDIRKSIFYALKKKYGLEEVYVYIADHKTIHQSYGTYLGISSNGYDDFEFRNNPESFDSWMKRVEKNKIGIWFQDLGRIYDSWEEFRKDLMVWKLAGMS